MVKKDPISVFFSWQSDSPRKTNFNPIKDAIKKAGKSIGSIYSDKKITLDDATRGVSGSPDIVQTLLNKISNADIFIADITTITDKGAKKASPNPNVMFELGFAAAELGWERIILIFNEGIGDFSKDLPFDIAKHRTSRYCLTLLDEPDKKDDLNQLIHHAIKLIIDKNPKRPAELIGKTRLQIQHEYDVENLRGLMSTIHLPVIDNFISKMPHTFDDEIFFFWEHFRLVYSGSSFHLDDQTLSNEFEVFAQAWYRALFDHGSYYQGLPNDNYAFTSYGRPFSEEVKAAWDDIDTARNQMKQSLSIILSYMRKNFIEVDLKQTDRDAWKFYKKINSN